MTHYRFILYNNGSRICERKFACENLSEFSKEFNYYVKNSPIRHLITNAKIDIVEVPGYKVLWSSGIQPYKVSEV